MPRYTVLILVAIVATIALPSVSILAQEHEHAAEEHAHGAAEDAYMHEYDEPPQQRSMLSWYAHSLGFWYSLFLPATGLFSFVLALVLVIRGGRYAGPALVFVVSLPLLIGAYAAVTGIIASYNVIAFSMAVPKPSQVAEGQAEPGRRGIFNCLSGVGRRFLGHTAVVPGRAIRLVPANADRRA